jgi:uncharacterized membrane protein YuzA (DUF378 family)
MGSVNGIEWESIGIERDLMGFVFNGNQLVRLPYDLMGFHGISWESIGMIIGE